MIPSNLQFLLNDTNYIFITLPIHSLTTFGTIIDNCNSDYFIVHFE